MNTKTINGVKLIESDDMVINHQQRTGKPFEAASLAFWQDNCEPGKVALDIGAYSGLYAITAAQMGCSVSAFEPNEAVFDRLEANCFINNAAVQLFACAVGAEHGAVELKKNAAVPLTSGGRVFGRGDIPMIPIDSMFLDPVCVVKIDVEGHEADVLRGMTDTIKRFKPAIITEALTPEAAVEQADILKPLGYNPKESDEHNICWSQS